MLLSPQGAVVTSAALSDAAVVTTPELVAMLRRCGALTAPFGGLLVYIAARGKSSPVVLTLAGLALITRGFQRFVFAHYLVRWFDIDPTMNLGHVLWLMSAGGALIVAATRIQDEGTPVATRSYVVPTVVLGICSIIALLGETGLQTTHPQAAFLVVVPAVYLPFWALLAGFTAATRRAAAGVSVALVTIMLLSGFLLIIETFSV
jgi:hypothetical protein